MATYGWVVFLASWGGITGFIQKVRTGEVRVFNLTELIGELCTSALSGVLTFWLCEQSGIAPLYAAVMIAISGHMGSRAIFLLEKCVEHKIEKKISAYIEDGK